MAKNTQEAEVVITMNGKAAQNALAALRKQQEQCNDAIKAGIDAQKELDKLRSTSIGDYQKVEGRSYVQQMKHLEGIIKKGKEGASTLRRLKDQINVTELATKKYAEVLKNINGSSLAELQAVAKQLKFEIRQLPPDTQKFIDKTKQLKDVNTRINQLTTSFKGLVAEEKRAAFSLKGLAEGFNRYFGMVTAGIAAITGISMAFRKAAQDAAALDDIYADVMKTTGLLHEEVAGLDKELMKINTRTSREQLLLLARDAGKLGITGKENILGFVRAADQIQVALGEDLGEGAIKNLGKIADVFGLTKEMGIEKSLLSIASAVNALGQASTASEAYLVDFAQRLAGVGAMAGLSVQDILGFASGLDQSAMKVEMAATAFQKFLMKMYEEPAKFAKYAGMQVEEFTELLKTNANEAITVVMKAMNGQDGFAAMVPVFNEMGLDGARAVGVLSAMTKNLDAVTEAQRLANSEFAKASSVTEEYNTKNNNLQANLEKARKEFQNASIALGQSLNPIMLKTTKATTYLVKALATYGKEIKAAVISIVAFTAVVKAHAIVQAAVNAATKIGMTLKATYKTIVLALRVAYLKLTGQMEAAAVAQKALTAAMSTNVFGLIATAVATLTVAIVHFIKKAGEANSVMKKMAEIEDTINKEFSEGAGKVQALSNMVHNNNLTLDQRRKALVELKKIVPEYHASLTEEGRLIDNNTEALSQYLHELEKVTRAKILQKEYEEAMAKVLEAEKNRDEALKAAGGNTATTKMVTRYHARTGTAYEAPGGKTDYGEALDALAEAQDLKRQIESRIEGEANRNTSEMQKALDQAAEKYKQLINEVNNSYDLNPTQKRDRIAEIKEEQKNEIAAIRQRYGETRKMILDEETTTNAILTQAQYDYVKARYADLTKKEQAMVDKEYTALSEEESRALAKRYAKLTADNNKANKSAYDTRIKQIEEFQRKQENALKESLMNNEITQAEYNARMNLLTMKSLQERINIAKKYGQDYTKYASQLLDEQIKLLGDSTEEIEEKMSYMPTTPKPGAIVDPQANEQFWEEIYKKRDDIVAGIQDKSLKTEFDTEMMWIEKLHENELLSEEEFEKAKLQTKLKYAQQYAEQASSIANQVSNFVNSLKEYETQKAEAEYQAQLTAAGDNAEQREAVEAAYEQKKLEIQKKYADTEMVINIAKTVAAGALAAIQAFAQLGPIGGAVAAALIAVTTAMEVATIVQQRNAIKNSSVNSSGSSSAPKTGNRTMTGYSEGGETPWAPSDNTPVGIVHANEYVIPAWMKRREPVLISNLERYRKAGSHGRSGSASRGFIDGGDTGSGAFGMKDGHTDHGADMYTIVRAAVVDSFESGAVRIVLVRKDISEIDNQDSRLKKQTSRWNS